MKFKKSLRFQQLLGTINPLKYSLQINIQKTDVLEEFASTLMGTLIQK